MSGQRQGAGRSEASGGGLALAASWPAHLPDVSAWLHCEGAAHELRWHRGRLVLEDHDSEAEMTMVALGAEPSPCLEMLAAWRDLEGVLAVTSSLTASALAGDGAIVGSCGADGVGRHGGAGGSGRAGGPVTIDHPQDRDRILLSMGGSFQQSVRSAQKYEPEERDRLLATIYRLRAEEVVAHLPMPFVARLVLTTLERLAVDRQARPVAEVTGFEVFLYRSARAAITRSMVAQLQVDPYAMHELDCRLGEPGCEMTVEGLAGRTARVEVSVPFSWALDVWLRGLSVVDGFAVLAAADTPVHEHVAPPDHEHSDHEPMSVAVTVLRWVGRPDGLAHPEAVAAVARRVDDQWSLVSID